MKKILICLTIAWAIFFLNSFYAHDIEPEYGFKIAQQDETSAYFELSSENLFLDDCLEDISDDDTEDDSERKKSSSGTTSYINTSFFRQFFFDDTLKNSLSSTFFFSSRAPLLAFLCVFRI